MSSGFPQPLFHSCDERPLLRNLNVPPWNYAQRFHEPQLQPQSGRDRLHPRAPRKAS